MPFQSNFIFTAPVRKFKANDPYYWEVDNIPLSQLEENCLYLRDAVDALQEQGGEEAFTVGGGGGGGNSGGGVGAGRTSNAQGSVTRSSILDLKPTVAGSVVSVAPGRFTARVNDAATLTEALSRPVLNADAEYLGQGTNWMMWNQVALKASIDKIVSVAAGDSLRLNGLFGYLSNYSVDNVGLGNYASIGNTVTDTLMAANTAWTGFPLITTGKVYHMLNNIFRNTANNMTYNQPLAELFTERWRGVTRTAVVDVPTTLTVTVPEYNANDYFKVAADGTKSTLGGDTQRIDLIFLYTKPIDQGSTKIISGGAVETTTVPKLGILLGAGLGLDFSTNTNGEYATIIRNSDSTTEADAYMLASKADIANTTGGILLSDGTTLNGSFPAPDDILNLAPLLANDINSTDLRLVGQSILPIAYVAVTAAQAGNIPTSHLIDIRPLWRTAELTYNERAGIAGAMPALSLANPAVGKRAVDAFINKAVTNALGTATRVDAKAGPIVPRALGGGYVWGGKRYGPEGAITAAMQDGGNWFSNGVYGMSYNQLPDSPDWDWATWTQYLDGTKDGAGLHKNDWINFKYTVNRSSDDDSTLDFQEPGATTDSSIFTNSFGTDMGKGATQSDTGEPSPLMMYWVKKRFWITLPTGFSNYCVKTSLVNCVSLAQGGLGRNSNREFESGGTQGVWVTKGAGWFEINVSWVGPDPYQGAGEHWDGWSTDSTKGASFPSSDRDTTKFRSWAVQHPGLSVTGVAAGNATNTMDGIASTGYVPANNANPEIKVDSIGVCTYPTISFEVLGFPSSWNNNGFLLFDSNMPHDGTTQLPLK